MGLLRTKPTTSREQVPDFGPLGPSVASVANVAPKVFLSQLKIRSHSMGLLRTKPPLVVSRCLTLDRLVPVWPGVANVAPKVFLSQLKASSKHRNIRSHSMGLLRTKPTTSREQVPDFGPLGPSVASVANVAPKVFLSQLKASSKHRNRAHKPSPTRPPPANFNLSRRPSSLASASSDIGPAPPPPRKRKPSWVRELEEDAVDDPEWAKVLEGADGDPDLIMDNARKALQDKSYFVTKEGNEEPPVISFNNVDIWLEFSKELSAREKELMDVVLRSWFMMGKLGGFNAQNMQMNENLDNDDLSFFEYDNQALKERVSSFVHDYSEVVYNGKLGRFKLDMGSCDEIALDILINTLAGYSKDYAGINKYVPMSI
eukprot:gene10414-8363_t